MICAGWLVVVAQASDAALNSSASTNAASTDVVRASAASTSRANGAAEHHRSTFERGIPAPLPGHPGNVYLEGEAVRAVWPDPIPARAVRWQLVDNEAKTVRLGSVSSAPGAAADAMELGPLPVGWYRLELLSQEESMLAWTTIGVLARLRAPVPFDSPVCVDSATAWFARDDVVKQKQLANLAALAGVNWIRDRLRWSDIQPSAGPLKAAPTTYDTAADAQRSAGLQVLQVFHDTPVWARESSNAGGRFAPDLRHVCSLGQQLAARFKGKVQAWEPWNEANVATFGGHTVDQMCSWQKAAWLGFKAGDPEVLVGWNATAAVPTPPHTQGLLANETWPYYDTYNIHTYDWSHAYADLWRPAREASQGRPVWITEADRGTLHLKNPPWFDQEPRLERLKAEWIAQAYASSLFAGADRHFHFILGHYHEPHGVQFGLLRLDLTPRPAYVALAAVGRFMAGARVLGRWRPGPDVNIYAFRAWPDGVEQDLLVAWAEKEVDWDGRGQTRVDFRWPDDLKADAVVDYLGRVCRDGLATPLTSAPVFVVVPPGSSRRLPLDPPPPKPAPFRGSASPVVLQLAMPRSAVVKVEDLPWSEGYAYRIKPGAIQELTVYLYNFATRTAQARLAIASKPPGWEVTLTPTQCQVGPSLREIVTGSLRIPEEAECGDGWVVLAADCGGLGRAVLAFRVLRDSPPRSP